MKIRGALDAYDRETKSYAVAYLDILGATNRIKKGKVSADESLNLLHNLYTMIMELADAEKGIRKYSDIRFKIFSDNIILAKELSADPSKNEDEVRVLLNCVSNFLCDSVGDSVGWLVRGGITIGDFYIDDTIVWGPALVRAYELEDKIAIYPRVILDAPVVEMLRRNKNESNFLCQDSDGMFYLNYMSIWSFSGEFVQRAFEKMKMDAIDSSGAFPDKIFQKLWWHKCYINQELEKKNESKDKNHRLEI